MAQRMTCVELREALADQEKEQMCARGTFTFTAPPDIFDLLGDTLRGIRALIEGPVSLGECLAVLAGEVRREHRGQRHHGDELERPERRVRRGERVARADDAAEGAVGECRSCVAA